MYLPIFSNSISMSFILMRSEAFPIHQRCHQPSSQQLTFHTSIHKYPWSKHINISKTFNLRHCLPSISWAFKERVTKDFYSLNSISFTTSSRKYYKVQLKLTKNRDENEWTEKMWNRKTASACACGICKGSGIGT